MRKSFWIMNASDNEINCIGWFNEKWNIELVKAYMVMADIYGTAGMQEDVEKLSSYKCISY